MAIDKRNSINSHLRPTFTKCLIYTFLMIVSQITVYSQESDYDCKTGGKEKDFEFTLNYSQLRNGFIGLGQVTSFELGVYEVLYYKQGVNIGYSLMSNSGLVELNQQLFGLFISGGVAIGVHQNFDRGLGSLYIRPEAVLDLFYLKISYAYTIPLNGETLGMNTGHNINFYIPIFASCGFSKLGGRKKYHLGHAHNYFGNTFRD